MAYKFNPFTGTLDKTGADDAVRINTITTVTFDNDYILVADAGTAVSNSLSTLSFTNARIGAIFTVPRHNAGSILLPSGADLLHTVGTYAINEDNFIQIVYVGKISSVDKVVVYCSPSIDIQTLLDEKVNITDLTTKTPYVSTWEYDLFSIASPSLTTQGGSTANIRACVFSLDADFIATHITFDVTTGGGASSVTRFAIYEVDESTMYPTTLVPGTDIAEFDTDGTPAVQTGTFGASITLLRNRKYAFAYQSNVGAPTFRAIAPDRMQNLGYNPAIGTSSVHYTIWNVARTYGAMPATFTAAATRANQGFPFILFRHA
jgi:hypothetical protein